MHVKERPILLSTDMVVATLKDRKTKTRRTKGLELQNEHPDMWEFEVIETLTWETGFRKRKTQSIFGATFIHKQHKSRNIMKCPYGQPGDLLWVRESWAIEKYFNGLTEECFPIFRADYTQGPVAWNWKPSIHMPKVAARIWLQITDIKVERLQQITEEDALAEGIIECEDGTYYNYFTQKGLRYRDGVECLLAKGSFQSLWCSINGLDSWAHNPWVWVISFKVLSKNGKPTTIPSGFQTPLSCDNESLKSSPSGTMQKQVEEAHLLPGNGEGKEVAHA